MDPKVPEVLCRTLLKAVERRDLPRDAVDLSDIFSSNEDTFGYKSTPMRRAVQEYWYNVKRRSIRSYSKLLSKFGVVHSDTTLRLLQEEGRVPSPDTSTASSFGRGDDRSDDLAASFEQLDISSPVQEVPAAPAINTSTPVPAVRPTALFPPSPPQATNLSFINPPQMISPNTEDKSWASSPTPSLTESLNSSLSEANYRGSSKSNPIVIEVNLKFPEANFPFEVSYLPHIEHNGYARDAVEIRTDVGVGDQPNWTAQMDDSNPMLKGRAILIQGRSRSSVLDAIESYHRKDSNSASSAAHRTIIEEIEMDPSRQALYWRLIMPKGVTLDNVLFSGDSREISMKETGVKYAVQGLDIMGMICSWTIAREGAGRKIAAVQKSSLQDLFA
jgi:hypothetical protein